MRPVSVEKRFHKFYSAGFPEECWNWQGKIREGRYGIIRKDGSDAYAHRVAFELAKRPLEKGEVVRHTCDNPACVNPAHLIAGTQADNIRDMHQRQRHCHGEAHHRTFFKADQIADMKRRLRAGATQAAVARLFEVDPRFVGKIARGERWGHVQ